MDASERRRLAWTEVPVLYLVLALLFPEPDRLLHRAAAACLIWWITQWQHKRRTETSAP